jgi:thioesterase domain-containing protein
LAAIIRAPVSYSRARLPADVVLARQGTGVPWFCFPALAGTGAAYLSSIVANAGASVFLLEAPGLDGTPPLSSVADLANRFALAIRSVAPHGPVRLLGWSFGGATAFVTARLLSAEGRSIDELVLVDPALPGTSLAGLDERDLAVAFIVDVAESVGKLSALEALGEETRARLRNRGPADMFQVAKALGIFPGSTSLSDFEHRFSVYTASAHALHQFTPSVPSDSYAGKSSILAASQGNGQQTAYWRPLLPGSAFTLFEASHYTILAHLRDVLR